MSDTLTPKLRLTLIETDVGNPVPRINADLRLLDDRYPFFNVKAFGALGDGSTDDTAAIQAAIDAADAAGGGIVYVPIGDYIITGITLSAGSGQKFVSLVGESPIKSRLIYNSSSGVALKLSNSFNIFIRNLYILSQSATRGTSVGVSAGGTAVGGGTQTATVIVEMVTIDGFDINWQAQDEDNSSSSEFEFHTLKLQNCNAGFYLNNFNSLNFQFYNLNMQFCGVGLRAATAGVYVNGGSASSNGIDFWLSSGGSFDIQNFRTENWTTHFLRADSTSLHIRNCLVQYADIEDPDEGIAVYNTGCDLHLDSCFVDGRIRMSGGSLILENCYVRDASPFFSDSAETGQGVRYYVTNSAGPSGRFADEQGVVAYQFPVDNFGKLSGATAFSIEYPTGSVFPMYVARMRVINRGFHRIHPSARLGEDVGDVVNIGSVKFRDSTYVWHSSVVREFLVRVTSEDASTKTYFLTLNFDDLAALPDDEWVEVAPLYGTPARSGDYALDIRGHDNNPTTDLDLRLRRTAAADTNYYVGISLETFSFHDDFVPDTSGSSGGPSTDTGETVVSKIAHRHVSPWITLEENSATPSVRHGNNFKTANTSTTTITNFVGGMDGQPINVLMGDGNTPIENNSNILTSSGTDIAAEEGRLSHFILDGTLWREHGSVSPPPPPAFSPSDIVGAKLVLESDTLLLSDGDPVGTWEDETSEGNDATQGTGGAKPTYHTGGPNGEPYLTFDGGDMLTTPSISFGNDEVTVVCVAKVTTKTTYGMFCCYGVSSAGSWNLRQYNTAGILEFVDGSSNSPTGTTGTGSNLQGQGWKILVGRVSAANAWKVQENSTETINTSQAFTLAASNAITIGNRADGGLGLNGDIAALGVFDTSLTTDLDDLINHWADKYGITL